MAGKLCRGTATGNAAKISPSRAFCEGLEYRAQGASATYVKANNPHEVGTEDHNAWDSGWDVAHAAATSTIDPDDAPCCAVTNATIAA